MKTFLIVMLVILVSACTQSRGFDRNQLRGQIQPPTTIATQETQETVGSQTQLPKPFKLALYFSPSGMDSANQFGWNWGGEDTDQLVALQEELASQGIVSQILPLPDSQVVGDDVQAIRSAAAHAGADAVLVVNGISDVDRYNNDLGMTYALLITPFFVPGTEVDSLFMVNATMWDVQEEYVYLSVETEGTAQEVGPPFDIYEKQLIGQAKANALRGLRSELTTRLRNMQGQMASLNP